MVKGCGFWNKRELGLNLMLSTYSLSFGFLTCKLGIRTTPTSLGCWADLVGFIAPEAPDWPSAWPSPNTQSIFCKVVIMFLLAFDRWWKQKILRLALLKYRELSLRKCLSLIYGGSLGSTPQSWRKKRSGGVRYDCNAQRWCLGFWLSCGKGLF